LKSSGIIGSQLGDMIIKGLMGVGRRKARTCWKQVQTGKKERVKEKD